MMIIRYVMEAYLSKGCVNTRFSSRITIIPKTIAIIVVERNIAILGLIDFFFINNPVPYS
jgi:hypothetical protein